jgi:hypothetical protein
VTGPAAPVAPVAPVESIPNLGPAMAAAFARAGIGDADALRALGADAAYARLIAAGERPHFIAYYALVMGLMGRPWNDCRGAEKAALRGRFDAILARARDGAGPGGIEAALAELGVVRRR